MGSIILTEHRVQSVPAVTIPRLERAYGNFFRSFTLPGAWVQKWLTPYQMIIEPTPTVRLNSHDNKKQAPLTEDKEHELEHGNHW